MSQRLTTILAAVLLCGPTLLHAQQGLWRHGFPAPLPGLAGTQVAGNGDRLAPGMRMSPGGQMLWHRGYTVAGADLPMQLGHTAEQGGALLTLGTYFAGTERALAVVYGDAQGQPTSGVRIVDPTAPYGMLAPWEMVVPAPDGGALVLKEGAYYLNADGSLRWARRYDAFQRPQSVAWAADGGFYAMSSGAGIVRYGPTGEVLRVLNTMGDRYDGILSSTVKYAPVLHDHKLYMGITTTFLDGGFLRTNAGVLVMDTLGNLLGQLMNGDLLSPPGQNAAGGHVALAVQGGRLLACLLITVSPATTLAYLLDCDQQLGDARWYAVEATGTTYVGGALPHNGTVVMGGAYGGDLMTARLVPGTALESCFPARNYTPAPLELTAFSGTPALVRTVAATVQPITVGSTPLPLLTPETPCTLVGLHELAGPVLRAYPNPATDVLLLQWPSWTPGSLLRMYDATGRLVQQERPGGPAHQLSVAHLAPGAYRIQLVGTHGTQASLAVQVLR